jgi:hypothetical protein
MPKKPNKPVPNVTNIFEFLKLDQRDFPRHLIGSEAGQEITIIGSGRNVWTDVQGLSESPNVMCVNDMGMYWPGRFKHWYSNDVEQLIHWKQGRRRQFTSLFGNGAMLHSCFMREGPEYYEVKHWPFPGQGSSGVVAILVALGLGYTHLTLAGMPFDNSGHFYDPPESHNLRKDRTWSNFLTETPDSLLERLLPLFRGRVNPLSGRLRGMLYG